jgi:hypothetical protein
VWISKEFYLKWQNYTFCWTDWFRTSVKQKIYIHLQKMVKNKSHIKCDG